MPAASLKRSKWGLGCLLGIIIIINSCILFVLPVSIILIPCSLLGATAMMAVAVALAAAGTVAAAGFAQTLRQTSRP